MPREFEDAEQHLSEQLISFWTHFADKGDPNGEAAAPGSRMSSREIQALTK